MKTEWTEEKTAELIRLYSVMTIKELADYLEMSYDAVCSKIWRLNLKKKQAERPEDVPPCCACRRYSRQSRYTGWCLKMKKTVYRGDTCGMWLSGCRR